MSIHKNALLPVAVAFMAAGCAVSGKVLTGGKASSHIGELKERLSNNPYTATDVRLRASGKIVAVIFNTEGGGIESIARRDDGPSFYSYLILDRAGKEGVETSGNAADYIQAIEKEDLRPFVILDSASREKAILFMKTGAEIASSVNDEGHVRIEISDDLYSGRRSLYEWRRSQRAVSR